MTFLIWETDNLCFDRRAITWADTLDNAVCHRGAMNVVTNDFMGFLVGIGEVAWSLFPCFYVTHKGEISCFIITRLNLHFIIIECTGIYTGWSTCLETHESYAQLFQAVRKLLCRTLTVWTAVIGLFTNDDTTA